MYHPETLQTIENILVGLRRDVLILSIKKHTLTSNGLHLILTIDKHLPEMVNRVRVIFDDETIDKAYVTHFYEYLLDICEEALGEARLPEIIENDETDLVEHVKNQFIQVIREIQKEVT